MLVLLAYLMLPVYLWPITLPLLLGLIWLAVRSRGRRRRLALGGIAILVVPPLLAFGLLGEAIYRGDAQRRAQYASTHSVLERETTFDGIALPAGTEITWTDASRTRWSGASLREPMDFLGLRVRGIARAQAGWHVILAEPRRIGDWACDVGSATVTGESDLVSCSLSEPVVWQGWTFPARSTVTLHRDRRTLDVLTPYPTRTVEGEMGRFLPTPATLHDDGSPARAAFFRDNPLRLGGVLLWGPVSWNYDPATLGQGQDRPAVTVEGRIFTPGPSRLDVGGPEAADDEVVLTVATGLVTRRAPGGR